jgi:hypothetical protein
LGNHKTSRVELSKGLTIKDKTELGDHYTCTLTLELQATNTAAKYAAEVSVEYAKTGAGWKLDHVGLLSLKKT